MEESLVNFGNIVGEVRGIMIKKQDRKKGILIKKTEPKKGKSKRDEKNERTKKGGNNGICSMYHG